MSLMGQGGLQVLGAVGSHMQKEAMAKYQRGIQRYNNKMVNLSNAMNQNAITDNLSTQRSKFARMAVDLEASKLASVASAEVSAAAANMSGNSVKQTIMDIQSHAAGKEFNRKTELNSMLAAGDQQRNNSSMSAKMQQSYNYIPGPSAAESALNLGTSLYDLKEKDGGKWAYFLKF